MGPLQVAIAKEIIKRNIERIVESGEMQCPPSVIIIQELPDESVND